jgi:hypothetical protein
MVEPAAENKRLGMPEEKWRLKYFLTKPVHFISEI